jgi:ATP-dependent Clp protease ATP-binding subunit ClpX
MFDVPTSESIAEITIEKETITEKKPPLIKKRNDEKIA